MVLQKGGFIMQYILQTEHLSKTIDGREIVKDINIHVKKGEIYGFLGPNGAGKTTVMKMVANLWKPTSGNIELFGEKLSPVSYEVLKRMGSIIEFPCFYEHMTGEENLQLHCEYMGYYMPGSVEDALEISGLADAARKPVKKYSLGMRQRLGIARAILCRPELLLLDEPVNGLDPAGMKQARDLFKKLSAGYGMSIIVSSHILSEVGSIADTIGVISKGRLIKEIPIEEVSSMSETYIWLSVEDVKKAAYILSDKLGLNNFKIMDKNNIRIYEGNITTKEISAQLVQNGTGINSIGTKSESLEDYFLKITGEGGK